MAFCDFLPIFIFFQLTNPEKADQKFLVMYELEFEFATMVLDGWFLDRQGNYLAILTPLIEPAFLCCLPF